MAQTLPVFSGEGNLSRYLQEIRRFPLLDQQEEYMLAKRWREHGDTEAAHRLVTSHLRLVAKIAMGYRGYGLPVSELISEGNVGMMQAVKRYDPERGFRLATYAMWWIKASIQEYILHSWSLVKIGTTAAQKKLFFNLRKLKNQMRAYDEGDLSPERVKKIAKELNVTEEEVVSMDRRLSAPDKSLNAPVRMEGEGEWQDWLVDDHESQEYTEQDDWKTGAAFQALLPCSTSVSGASSTPWPRRRAADTGRAVGRVRHQPRARARGARLRGEGACGQGRRQAPDPGPAYHRGTAGGLKPASATKQNGGVGKLAPPFPLVTHAADKKAHCRLGPASWRSKIQRGSPGVWPSIGLRLRQAAAVYVYLKRMQDEPRHRQGFVARLTDVHEISFRLAHRYMGVGCLLQGHGRLPLRFTPALLIVVPCEEPRRLRQRQDSLDRAPKPRRTTARKIRSRRAAVGHEHCVVDKGCIASHVGDRCQRVAG